MKNASPLTISIALCTYNGERFLQEQLDSLGAQTRLPDEVVVGDDGSADRTMEILEHWAEKVPFPVRIQRNTKGLGPAKNFEAVMERCTGDIVFLCDQDDVWFPEKIQKMSAVFEARPEIGLVYCEASTIDENGRDLGIARSEISRAHVLNSAMNLFSPNCTRHNPPGCCSAVRRVLLEKVLPIPEDLGHDMLLFLRVPALADVKTLWEPLIQYRFHGQNASFHDDWQAEFRKIQSKERTCYRWETGVYFLLEPKIQAFLDWLEGVPDSPYKRRCIRYVKGNQVHYPNRYHLQRNFFIFFPLFFWEVFTGRYFQRFQPFKSMAYDVLTGLKNGLNPIATLKLAGNVIGKVWRKLLCR
ncbi:MAG: glycosyltransferase family 2 protein [Thermoguttaceae bacterium]|nr:glycosyltransferase family 2 protein [Thermoguttaceae bacterium]